MRLLTLAALAAGLGAADTALTRRIDAIVNGSPAARQAFWGVHVVDLATGVAVVSRNAGSLFIPASNTKLYSSALALARLGLEHRFQTRVLAESPVDSNGTLVGDLWLSGGGDPTLSARTVPYERGPVPQHRHVQALHRLAEEVAAAGVRRITGDVVGDDSAYVWEPYPEGWALADTAQEYGAPVSALTVNDNAVAVTIFPGGHSGAAALVDVRPAEEFYTIHNRVVTGAKGEVPVRFERLPGSLDVRFWGMIAPKGAPVRFLLAVDDPALWAAQLFKEALEGQGILISGRVAVRHRYAGQPPPVRPQLELASRISAPLVQLAQIVNKVSQNLHAELLLREVARVRGREPSREDALKQLAEFLAEAGVARSTYTFEDGSGLSRLNLVSPATTTALLVHMYRSPWRESWLRLLPISGQDGTLRTRFAGKPNAPLVRAKTGSLSHIAALAGYTGPEDQPKRAFSIMVNNFRVPEAQIYKLVDAIALAIAE